jgi:methyl-accepting chemotaxis protein
MNSISPRVLISLFVPLVAAGVLTAFFAAYRTPAFIMAAVAFAATWYASSGQSGGHLINRVSSAVRALRDGERLPAPPEGLNEEARALFSELQRAEELWQADRSKRAEVESKKAEIEKLRAELAGLRGQSGEVAGALRVDRSQALEVTHKLEAAIQSLRAGLDSQMQVSAASAGRIRELTTAVAEMGNQVELLASSAEESSSAILEMTTTNDQMANNIEELGTSVRESVASIEEMTFSIKEVAKNVDALALTAEQTSSSMNEMDVSIDQVQSNANETARLSEEVARDAETGAEAILKTIGEIYRIKESSQEAVSVISNLGSRIDAIGQILNVIDEVAEQTNLLALNAAIIAAQAGEHGKGFAVVADEIKDLAERAGASTKEIADLIKTIQAESRNAIQAVERGAQNVDRGVQVSNDAERALKKILESSQKSTNMVRAIARATVEQAKGSKQVTDSIGRIAETVQQIAAATSEQARGSELIMSSGEKMRTIAQQVERSSQEQSRGGRQITNAIENISAMVHQINAKYRKQNEETGRASALEKDMAQALKDQGTALQLLSPHIETLRRLADATRFDGGPERLN